MRAATLSLLVLVAGCSGDAPRDLAVTLDQAMTSPDLALRIDLRAAADQAAIIDAAATMDLALTCRADKMMFTQATGCQNDGSVEFCAPAGDPAALAAVKKIAPQVHCAPGGGRAGCDPARELLCSYPTGPGDCDMVHGALNARAWSELCRLSGLAFVRQIVPTWLE